MSRVAREAPWGRSEGRLRVAEEGALIGRCHLFYVLRQQLELLCKGQTEVRGQAAAAAQGVSRPLQAVPSFRLPMTACFFRKSLHSFLLRPKASMLCVNVLKVDGRETWKQEARGAPQHASRLAR